MSKWNTEEISRLIGQIENVASVTRHSQGGDVDTANLLVHIKGVTGERIRVLGFVTEGEIHPRHADACEIEMIEVTDGQQSDTGLSSSNEALAVVYAQVCARLRKAGHAVVPSLKAYF